MQNITSEEQKVIDDLLAELDFEKIQGYMAFTGWKYYDTDVPPSQERLIECATRLILDVLRKPDCEMSSCGGFEVRYHDYEPPDDYPQLEIKFIAQSNSTYWKKDLKKEKG